MKLCGLVSATNRRSVTQALRVDAKLRNEAIATFGLGLGRSLETVTMFSNGQPVDEKLRDELLAKCAAGAYVELDVPMLAYEQTNGEPNRNFVRVRDGGIARFASSAVGMPFLRDHEHYDSNAIGGRITKSTGSKREDGTGYDVHQTVRLTEPSAVSRALRNLMSSVSISWRSVDNKVNCSACDKQIFTDCYHLPGMPLRKMTDGEGKDSWVVDRKNPTLRVEWVYNAVEAIETSEVPVPAVKNAKIDAIRNTIMMSAGLADEDQGDQPEPEPLPITENNDMSDDLVKTLNAKIARLTKVVDLSDSEKEYFRRLNDSAQDDFLALSLADRAEKFKVVYTAKNGTTYTAMDDKRMIQLAKDRDEDNVRHEKDLAASRTALLMERADRELAHVNGTTEQRAALLGAVENIENAEHRTAALSMLTEIQEKAAPNFSRQGTGGKLNPKKAGQSLSLDAQMQALADEVKKNNPELSDDQAYVQACESDKGRVIYAAMNDAFRNKNAQNAQN